MAFSASEVAHKFEHGPLQAENEVHQFGEQSLIKAPENVRD
jgi:hypothetical protein